MRVGFAQINTTVGDIKPNAEKILAAYREASRQGAQLVITPELALTGYPPQDLVFKSGFVPQTLEQLRVLHGEIGTVPLLGTVRSLTTTCRVAVTFPLASALETGRS